MKLVDQLIISHVIESPRHPFQSDNERQLPDYRADHESEWNAYDATNHSKCVPSDCAQHGRDAYHRKQSNQIEQREHVIEVRVVLSGRTLAITWHGGLAGHLNRADAVLTCMAWFVVVYPRPRVAVEENGSSSSEAALSYRGSRK